MRLVGHEDPILRQVAATVEDPSSVWPLANRMVSTIRAQRNAIALAAPQVGVSIRLVVIELPDMLPVPWVNPRLIVHPDAKSEEQTEGCMSWPGRRWLVERPDHVLVTAVSLDGSEHLIDAIGGEARMWQHEVDHLDGVCVFDGQWPEIRQGRLLGGRHG